MLTDNRERLRQILDQEHIPVPIRTASSGLRIRLPYRTINRAWLKADRRTNPRWNRDRSFWTVPKAWFNAMVQQCLETFGRVYVIQPYREQEKCASACMNALGHECQCSCMGANHGAGGPGAGWFEVSETFASRWEDSHLACRFMKRTRTEPSLRQ